MNSVISVKNYTEPSVSEREILRYSGCKTADRETEALIKSCVEEMLPRLSYKVCYRVFDVSVHGDLCDFGLFSLNSADLARNLTGASRAVIFAATVGVEADRLIAKYARLSPSRALILQAVGAERIEALCDVFCDDIAKEYNASLKPRFSPGYGDLPLESQRKIFDLLSPERNIGLFLTESLLMSPSKSVTAITGLCGK